MNWSAVESINDVKDFCGELSLVCVSVIVQFRVRHRKAAGWSSLNSVKVSFHVMNRLLLLVLVQVWIVTVALWVSSWFILSELPSSPSDSALSFQTKKAHRGEVEPLNSPETRKCSCQRAVSLLRCGEFPYLSLSACWDIFKGSCDLDFTLLPDTSHTTLWSSPCW